MKGSLLSWAPGSVTVLSFTKEPKRIGISSHLLYVKKEI